MKQKDIEANTDSVIEYLRPFRIIISLLDKPEIGKEMQIHVNSVHLQVNCSRFNFILGLTVILSVMSLTSTGPLVLSDVLLEVVRAFYSYCKAMLGEDALNSSLSGSQLNKSENQ